MHLTSQSFKASQQENVTCWSYTMQTPTSFKKNFFWLWYL